jgi:MFS transporter, PAT family, beta-lactamase induction signal transducer AmpG
LATTAGTLLLLGLIRLEPNAVGILGIVVFISQVASTLVMLPLGGLMAHTVADEAKGRAAGWYQAGNLGGNGVGGGAGVWIAAHFSKEASAGALAAAMLLCALALYFVSDVRLVTNETVAQRMRLLGRDVLAILRSAIPLFITVLVCSPIGAGGMNNLWSAVAPDRHASPDRVALVSGILNGVIAAVGCVMGGWVADRIGLWCAYFGSGVAIAYAFTNGLGYAAFSAVVLVAIGRGAASTKYATLSSLGNLPVVYMTALDGWVHDRFGSAWMLHTDALTGIVCIVIGLFVLQKIRAAGRATRSRPETIRP